jgi:tripartite-type tricarboxylate transporter receptor subunit TctC
VPFGAGGPTDVIARVVAQRLSEAWGQQVITENIPGAGGNTGVAMVAKAPADGYTILVVSTGFMVNPSMYSKIPYDPVKDFAPVTLVAASPNVISAHPSLPATTLKELVELVKANPGKYSFAQPSTGSTPHLAGELFKQEYKLDLVTVPFNSAALAINSTLGGHTPLAFTALPPAMSNIKEGKLRGLAVLSAQRSPALPEVPTNAEAGVPGLESDTLTGIVAPAGTPKEIIERWRNDIVKMVALPEVKQRLEHSALRRWRIRPTSSANASRPRSRAGARSCATRTSRRIEHLGTLNEVHHPWAVTSSVCRRGGRADRVSDPAGARHRAVPGRRRNRHHCPPDGAEAVRGVGPSALRGESRRRRRQYRHGHGGNRAGRRP